MLLRAKKVERFMEDTQFYNYYLKSNSNEQTSVSTFIELKKEHVLRKTKRSDRDPFNPNPGEGTQRDQTLDQIYTNLVIHEGRVDYDLTGGREKRLEEYPKRREQAYSCTLQENSIWRHSWGCHSLDDNKTQCRVMYDKSEL